MNLIRPLAGLCALLAGLLLLTVWWDPNLAWGAPNTLILLNALPVALIAGVLLGVSRRPVWSLLLVAALLGWVFYVNAVKLDSLNQPAVFEDMLLVYQTVRGFDLLGKYGNPLVLALVVVAVIAMAARAWRLERPRLAVGTGFALALLSAAALASLGQASLPLGSLYYSAAVTPQDWDPVGNAKRNGLLASITRSAARVTFDHDRPLPAALPRPSAVEEKLAAAPAPTAARPDVLLVLNESFFDPAILAGVDDCELLPSWCALREQGRWGTLTVPTYGGNTTRTEFELLTGVPFARLEGLDYPYVTVVTRPLRSLVWMLRDQGYETVALHNHHGYFWNRNTAFPRLGFERFIGLEELGRRVEMGFFADDRMLDAALDELLDLPADAPPRFLFVVTMENHGPWNERRRERLPDDLEGYRVPAAALAIPGAPLQQYLFHADRSVRQLERLWRRVARRERDTLMIVFGDHLPGLSRTFEAVGFDDGGVASGQVTPFLVLANHPLPGKVPGHLPTHQLLLQVLKAAGGSLDPRYAELRAAWLAGQEADGPELDGLRHYRERLERRLLGAPVRSVDVLAAQDPVASVQGEAQQVE